jgi:hypothetical protein
MHKTYTVLLAQSSTSTKNLQSKDTNLFSNCNDIPINLNLVSGQFNFFRILQSCATHLSHVGTQHHFHHSLGLHLSN